jgi:putative GTP pyrophosphokinase
MPEDIKSVVEKYRSLRPLYEGFALKLEPLLRDILEANNIKYQVVESRAKEIPSFEEKISRPGKSYGDPLKDITDLCGCVLSRRRRSCSGGNSIRISHF